MLKLIMGFMSRNMIYVWLVIGTVACVGSGYAGYVYCDHRWQKAKITALEEAREENLRLLAKLAKKQDEVAEAKQKRKVVYREKIKYVTSAAPDCSLESDGMRELVCAVAPSSCKR